MHAFILGLCGPQHLHRVGLIPQKQIPFGPNNPLLIPSFRGKSSNGIRFLATSLFVVARNRGLLEDCARQRHSYLHTRAVVPRTHLRVEAYS